MPSPPGSDTVSRFALEKSLTHLLHRVGQTATDAFQRQVGELQITARQFAVLMAIARMEGASQMDVVKVTGIDRSTLADMVARMLGKGLIERQRSRQDGRAYCLSLTAQGRQMLAEACPAAIRADEQLLSGLAHDKRDAMLALLADILQTGGPVTLAGAEHD